LRAKKQTPIIQIYGRKRSDKKMKKYTIQFAILLVSLVLTQTAFADVKIKSRQTMSGQTYENSTYIKGKRQHTESMNGQTIVITQCDLRRDLQLEFVSNVVEMIL